MRLGLTPPLGVNDVVVTRDGAYFTDSLKPFLYRVPITPSGTLGMTSQAFRSSATSSLARFNVNGIDATPNGKTLVIVQLNTGELFTVEPTSGVAYQIALGGGSVPG